MKTFEMNEDLWAWVAREDNGVIYLIGVHDGRNWLPAISHKRASIMAIKSIAETHHKVSGHKVWLRRYTCVNEYPLEENA